MVTSDRRDRRQFKGIPYPDPVLFPPPTADDWHGIGTTAPVAGNSEGLGYHHKARKHHEKAGGLSSAMTTAALDTAHPTSEALLDMALARGFEITKTTDVHHIKKGTYRFQLPKTGFANQWTTNALIGICTDYDIAQGIRGGKPSALPLQVEYNKATWAVVSQNAAQYNLQNLDNGSRTWVAKDKVEVLMAEDSSPAIAPAPNPNGFKVLPKEEVLAQLLPPPPITNKERAEYAQRLPEIQANPLGNWASTTYNAIKALRLDIERDLARIRPRQEQLRELERVYASITGKDVEGPSPVNDTQYKRTVLPPQGDRRRQNGSPARDWSKVKEVMKAKYLETGSFHGYGYLRVIMQAVQDAGLPMPITGKQYELIKGIREELGETV